MFCSFGLRLGLFFNWPSHQILSGHWGLPLGLGTHCPHPPTPPSPPLCSRELRVPGPLRPCLRSYGLPMPTGCLTTILSVGSARQFG